MILFITNVLEKRRNIVLYDFVKTSSINETGIDCINSMITSKHLNDNGTNKIFAERYNLLDKADISLKTEHFF